MMKDKLKSRKFWVSVAAFLGSIATSISGIVTGEKWVTIVGTVCAMLSMAIYAAVEAYTDVNAGSDIDSDVTLQKIKKKDPDGSTQEYTFTPKEEA